MSSVRTYTKPAIIAVLRAIRAEGWIKSSRNTRNDGAIGNTLEDLLGIKENNLPLPNASEWELKTQRRGTTALLTLFHLEPSPRGLHIADYLAANFGWRHKDAGTKYPDSERSFRQTVRYGQATSRGFFAGIDDDNRRVVVRFDPSVITSELADWKAGLPEYDADYLPYWGFDDLYHKAGVKLGNCFYVSADVKQEGGETFYWYLDIMQLSGFSLDGFLAAIRERQVHLADC